MIEKMNEFFEARVEGYDEHMINNVEGCKEGYKVLSELIQKKAAVLLDYYNENRRLRKEQGIKDGEFYHYDTPCTVSNEISMFKKVGFKVSKMVWRFSNTTIIENIKSFE